MTLETKGFDQWAILEIMGHNRYAGRVSEQTVGGAAFVRVDVPAVDGLQPFTKLFGAGSIYCITPVTEEVATALAKSIKAQPMSVYDLPDEIKSAVRTVQRLEAAKVSATVPGDVDDYDDGSELDPYDSDLEQLP